MTAGQHAGVAIADPTRATSPITERRLSLDPQVAVRPEPFGALAYHYGSRKLVFLRHPDMVRVVRQLDHHDTVGETLRACGIPERRWPSFATALESLVRSELLHERRRSPATQAANKRSLAGARSHQRGAAP